MHALDLDSGDVLAAGDDDVLGAVPQLDIAVRVHAPPGRRSGTSRPGTPPPCPRASIVARHHVVAAHDDLAHRLAVGGHVLHLLIHDARLLGDRVADALPGLQPRLLLGRQLVPLRLPLTDGVRAVRLGEAIDMVISAPSACICAMIEGEGGAAAVVTRSGRVSFAVSRPGG